MKKLFFLILFVLILTPITIYATKLNDHDESKEKPLATFRSKEGVLFQSFSENWDKDKLKQLNKELLKNTHGNEIESLTKVIVIHKASKKELGAYYPYERKIILYNGKKMTKPIDFRFTLSHEYGHHVQEVYFPKIDKKINTKWSKLRGLKNYPVVTGNSGESKHEHKWYLSEIFADDYVLLFGPKEKTPFRLDDDSAENVIDIDDMSTIHENQEVPNVMELKALQHYLEEETGFQIKVDQLLNRPKMVSFYQEQLYTIRYWMIVDSKMDLSQDKRYEQLSYAQIYDEQNDETFLLGETDYSMILYHDEENRAKENITYYINHMTKRSDGQSVLVFTFETLDYETGLRVESKPLYVRVKNETGHDKWHFTKDEITILNKEEIQTIQSKLKKPNEKSSTK